MFAQEIPENVKTTTPVSIRYDCDGEFERCGKLWRLKFKDAKKNFEKNNGKHICRKCWLKNNNPAKRKEVQEKIKKTCMERYGASCALNTEENTKARVEAMFGDEKVSKEIVAKRKKTSQERYGTDHPMQNDEIKTKQQAVLTEKYGVSVPLKNKKIAAKMRKTVRAKFGVDNVAQDPEVRKKMAETTLERHGVEHYNQLPEMKEYLREHCPEWLKESWEAGGPNKGITRPDTWNQKQRETVMKLMDEGKWDVGPKYSIKGHYQSKKCKRLNPMFRSSYELKTHWHLDNDPEVKWYDYEPFRVAYYDSENIGEHGHKRYYVIDFVVKYKSSDKPLAIEVKNDYLKKRFEECGKVEAFEKECGDMLDFIIWSNKEIGLLNLDLETLLESSLVERL